MQDKKLAPRTAKTLDATATRRARRPAVGGQVRRWRHERGLTLSQVAGRSGLNVGYLSQVENDKASPSLETLAAVAEALEVPIAWFLADPATPPVVVRAGERPERSFAKGARVERIDGGTARDLAIIQAFAAPGLATGAHTHPGEEHHLIVSGRWRFTQGDHVLEVGPGDYVRWDGTVPHDAVNLSDEEGSIIIVSVRRPGPEPGPAWLAADERGG